MYGVREVGGTARLFRDASMRAIGRVGEILNVARDAGYAEVSGRCSGFHTGLDKLRDVGSFSSAGPGNDEDFAELEV